jgi:hypothetical protein
MAPLKKNEVKIIRFFSSNDKVYHAFFRGKLGYFDQFYDIVSTYKSGSSFAKQQNLV